MFMMVDYDLIGGGEFFVFFEFGVIMMYIVDKSGKFWL